MHLALGASIWGYNIGILSSILVHDGWRFALGDPRPAQKGVITGIYYAGTLFSYLFLAHPLADAKGRRFAARIGALVICFGALFMATAAGPGAIFIMSLGRFVCGVGVGVISTTVPLYQRLVSVAMIVIKWLAWWLTASSEISPAKQRGKLVTMNHAGFITGLAFGLW